MQELTAELQKRIEMDAIKTSAFYVIRETVAGMAYELMAQGVKPSEILGAVNDGFETAWKVFCEATEKSNAGH